MKQFGIAAAIAAYLCLCTGVGAQGDTVEQWRPAVQDACAVYGCSTDYVLSIIACESGGDPSAWHPNPNGGADVGLLQINDATWGSVAYADGVTQIWWAASHIGSVWWACG